MATDAEIRAAGLYAVPNRQYLQNEFQLPTKEVVEEISIISPTISTFISPLIIISKATTVSIIMFYLC